MQFLLDIGLYAAVLSPLALALHISLRALRFFDMSLSVPFLVSGYGAYALTTSWTYPTVAILAGVATGLTLGFLTYRYFTTWLIRRGASPSSLLLATLGLAIAAEQVVSLTLGPTPLIVPVAATHVAGEAPIGMLLAVILGGISVAAVCWLDLRTGAPLRAVAENRELAAAYGLNVQKWLAAGAAVACLLAAISGVAQGVIFQLRPSSGIDLIMVAAAPALLFNRSAQAVLWATFLVSLLLYVAALFISSRWQFGIYYAVLFAIIAGRSAYARPE